MKSARLSRRVFEKRFGFDRFPAKSGKDENSMEKDTNASGIGDPAPSVSSFTGTPFWRFLEFQGLLTRLVASTELKAQRSDTIAARLLRCIPEK